MRKPKKKTSKSGPKRSIAEREIQREETWRLHLLGYTQWQIGERLNISAPMVGYDINARKERLKTVVIDKTGAKQEALEAIRLVRQLAMDAYVSSDKDAEKELEEFLESEKGGHTKTVRSKEGRLKASEFLNIIRQTVKDERDLLGLDEPVKVEGTIRVVDPIWADIAQRIKEKKQADLVKDRMEVWNKQVALLPAPKHEEPTNGQTNGEAR